MGWTESFMKHLWFYLERQNTLIRWMLPYRYINCEHPLPKPMEFLLWYYSMWETHFNYHSEEDINICSSTSPQQKFTPPHMQIHSVHTLVSYSFPACTSKMVLNQIFSYTKMQQSSNLEQLNLFTSVLQLIIFLFSPEYCHFIWFL